MGPFVQIKLSPENEAVVKKQAEREKRSPTFIANDLIAGAISLRGQCVPTKPMAFKKP
jgi:hypothetical protein